MLNTEVAFVEGWVKLRVEYRAILSGVEVVPVSTEEIFTIDLKRPLVEIMSVGLRRAFMG